MRLTDIIVYYNHSVTNTSPHTNTEQLPSTVKASILASTPLRSRVLHPSTSTLPGCEIRYELDFGLQLRVDVSHDDAMMK